MIICPRCGYQAPDESPWCPRCGYGAPPQMQQQQPSRIPQQTQKSPKKKLPKWAIILLVIIGIPVILFIAVFIWAVVDTVKNPTPTYTPTITCTATATYTPTITNTPKPTLTPKPTRTPAPTATERPAHCNIKGNRNTKIYHCKNSPNYDMTTDFIQWFCSPAEAEAAGYTMSGNQGGWCQQ